MAWNLEKLNESTKFFDGMDKKEWLKLRLMPDEVAKKYRRECGIKMVQKPFKDKDSRQMVVAPAMTGEESNYEKFDGMQKDYQIEDWYLEDDKGNAIPCDKAIKLKLWYEAPVFANLADMCIRRMEAGVAKQGKEYIAYFDQAGDFQLIEVMDKKEPEPAEVVPEMAE